MRTILLALFVSSGILASSAVAPADAGQRLTGAQIRSFFSGVMTGYYKDTRQIRIQATRAGNVVAWFEGKVDTGTWKIVGDQVCVAFKVWTGSKFKCRYVERDGAWFRAVKANGKSKFKFRR